jgi:hypothetical protein
MFEDDKPEPDTWFRELLDHHHRVGEIDIEFVKAMVAAGRSPLSVVIALHSYYCDRANALQFSMRQRGQRGQRDEL